MKTLASLLLISAIAFAQGPARYRLDTAAGTSAIGDGGAAISAILSYPNAVLADDKGGFYVADEQHYRIRYVAANGVIRTVVGAGVAGLTPDGVAGLENSVTTISAMALSANGDLYFVDQTSCILLPR